MKESHMKKLLVFAVALWSGFSLSQDFPTLKGDNARTGHNNSPATGGPGVGNLMWFKPNQGFVQLVRQVMNEAAVPQPESTKTGTWTPLGPATFQDEALMVFAPFPTGDPAQDNLSGFTEYSNANATNPSTAVDYYIAHSIPSGLDLSNPTAKLNPGDTLSTFSWKVEPVAGGNGISNAYALYAWIPVGPTIDPVSGNTIFQQR